MLSIEKAPSISKELLDKLNSAFPSIDVVPNKTTIEQVMFNAGQRSIIDFINRYVKERGFSGDINDLSSVRRQV